MIYGNNLDYEKIEYYQENIIEACSVKHSDWVETYKFSTRNKLRNNCFMAEHQRKFLNKNEKAIVELTLQGENQTTIAKKLNISPSTIYRALRREPVVAILNQATQGILSSLVQKNLSTYEKGLDRIDREIETMPIQQVIYYLNHGKAGISKYTY